MILLLWLLLLLSCMITYIHYCFIIIVITMLIMIVYYYVYKRLQQFLTRLTGLRKDLVTVNVHFYALYLCVRACVCACSLCCLLCFCMSNILSCLLLWNLFYGVQRFHVCLRIYIFVFMIIVIKYVRLLELLGLSAVLDAHYYYCCCCCY